MNSNNPDLSAAVQALSPSYLWLRLTYSVGWLVVGVSLLCSLLVLFLDSLVEGLPLAFSYLLLGGIGAVILRPLGRAVSALQRMSTSSSPAALVEFCESHSVFWKRFGIAIAVYLVLFLLAAVLVVVNVAIGG